MKKILLLVDLNTGAEYISKSALKIASQLKADVILASLNNKVSLVKELQVQDGFVTEENHCSSIGELAGFLKNNRFPDAEFAPNIVCNELDDDKPLTLKEFVIKNNIWMVIQGMPFPCEKNSEKNADSIVDLSQNINCPRLFLPEHFALNQIDKIAYFTDLRYCDTGVIRFLKTFNAFIFITHLSASGLPDIDQKYAYDILSNEIAVKSFYKKLFLRNIKRTNFIGDIEKVIETDDIKMSVIISRKHGLLEELLPAKSIQNKSLHELPLLVLPFLNWHTCVTGGEIGG